MLKSIAGRASRGSLFVAAICILTTAPAFGVIVGTTYTSDFTNPDSDWYGMNWDYVYRTRGGTSVAVSGFHLITAEHYAISVGNSFTIGGEQFEVTAMYSPGNDPGESVPPDLRILELKNNTNPGNPMPGYYQLYTGSFTVGQDTIIVGTGNTGEDYSTYYTETPETRAKRWGTNEYTSSARIDSDRDDPPDGADWSTFCIKMNYNTDHTEYEAGVGGGDSGSGVFVNDGGVWKLAAINLYQDEDHSGRLNGALAASVPRYSQWINDTIPEPATVSLLGLGVLVLTGRRRRGAI